MHSLGIQRAAMPQKELLVIHAGISMYELLTISQLLACKAWRPHDQTLIRAPFLHLLRLFIHLLLSQPFCVSLRGLSLHSSLNYVHSSGIPIPQQAQLMQCAALQVQCSNAQQCRRRPESFCGGLLSRSFSQTGALKCTSSARACCTACISPSIPAHVHSILASSR